MLEKAPGLGADEIILDLEDAVAPGAKDAARELVVRAVSSGAMGDAQVSVRVNAPRTPWCHADLIALAAVQGVTSVVVPKVESAEDLAFVDRLLDGAEAAAGRPSRLRTQGLIETAAGLAAVREIARCTERLDALILGYADLAASLGRTGPGAADLDGWRPAQDALLVAARANGVQAIDGPYLGVQVDEGFTAAATRAAQAGFDGKWAIHPSQVPALNELFTPSDDDVAHARAVIEALDTAGRDHGAGAVALDGQMLDEAVRVAAQRTLARAGRTVAV
jgi:citrate lyase subunit beta/citryl-CoA lyase